MTDIDKLILELDLKHLTKGDIDWLHFLKNKAQAKAGREYVKKAKGKDQ